METAAWIALFSPAVGVALIAIASPWISRRLAGYVATLSVFVSFIASLVVFFVLLDRNHEDRAELSSIYTWLTAGDLQFDLEIFIDPLSVFMMLIVSGVGFLILAYAVGYMKGDEEEQRYHAYKALFVFSMLLLVMSGNLLLVLAGWGMVGLSSYLLINFWHRRSSAVAAGKKAFVMNAFGDVTFMIALFILIVEVGFNTLDFPTVFGEAEGVIEPGSTVAVLIALGLLGGAVAKSAQVPLHTWLPDAMEGPTPVSALIHAATMVTAGVYLVVRTHVLFELAPIILELTAILGGVTIVFAGLFALVQTDIKRIIAYSTMSQIGYMFLAVGLMGYGAGMFHLMTHAFFKALLFLAAGVVIHALIDEQDIRKMGGLAKELPWTYRAFLVGTLALAAIPPFSGFFSKEAILATAAEVGNALGWSMWVLGAIGALLTALYAFRLVFIAFKGEPTAFVREHLHKERLEGPFSMIWPVGILSFFAIFAGWLWVPGGWKAVENWLEPVAESAPEVGGATAVWSAVISVALAVVGIIIAWRVYGRRSDLPERIRRRVPHVTGALEHKFYFDEAYDVALYEPTSRLAVYLQRYFESPLLLKTLDSLGSGVSKVSEGVAAQETGYVRRYVFAIAAGLAVIALVFIAVE